MTWNGKIFSVNWNKKDGNEIPYRNKKKGGWRISAGTADRFYFFLTGEAWSIPIVSRIHRARTRNGVKIVETDFHADIGEIHGKAGSLVLEAVRYGNGRDAVRIHV